MYDIKTIVATLKLKFLQYKATKSWNPLSTCFKKGVLNITYNTYPFCNANNSLKVRWHRWFTNKVSPFLFLSWHLPCLLAQCSDPMGNSGASSKTETIRRKQFSCQIFHETKQSLSEKKRELQLWNVKRSLCHLCRFPCNCSVIWRGHDFSLLWLFLNHTLMLL